MLFPIGYYRILNTITEYYAIQYVLVDYIFYI